MKLRTSQKLLLSAGAVVVVIAIVGASLNETGYCIKKVQFLSDNELIRSVLESDLRNTALRKGIDLNGKWPTVLPEADFYSTPGDIISLNPNCCHLITSVGIGDDFIPFTTLMKVTGRARGYVVTNYSRARNKSPEQTKTLVTNCGDIHETEDWFLPN